LDGLVFMRVIFNQLAALGPKTGIGHYTAELFRCLVEQSKPDEIHGFPHSWLRVARQVGVKLRPLLESKHKHSSSLRAALLSRLRRYGEWQMTRQLLRACRRQEYDLYHEPNFNPLPIDVPTVTTVHDLSVLLHPEWHPADRVRYFENHFPRALERSRHFIADSECTRQQMIRLLGVAPKSVTRIYIGVRPILRPLPETEVQIGLRRLGLPPRYLLCVGTIEPRKNILRLLQAYCALAEPIRSQWPLLLVGSWGWNSAAVARYLDEIGRQCGVLHLGYLPEDYLAVLYNGARALLYPSLYEGFGLPPLEMMACGGAVLASTAEAVAETAGQRACLIDPEDVDSWRQAIERVLTDDGWWQSLRTGSQEAARPFTWERCATQTLQVYRALARSAILPFQRPEPERRAA
jgi:alpha-1,3-rhamnosyl/mannosyltransferase